MNNVGSTKSVGWMWQIGIAAYIAVAVCGLILRSQAVMLERVHDSLQAELRDKQQRKQRLGDLVTQARAIQIQQSSELKELKQLQKRVTTRDQFLVTSGDPMPTVGNNVIDSLLQTPR